MKYLLPLFVLSAFVLTGIAVHWHQSLHQAEPASPSLPAPLPAAIEHAPPAPATTDTLPALAAKEFTGSDLVLTRVIEANEVYTRHSITYRSEGFTVSGILVVPHGEGPFPVLVLNHGYVDPETYRNGEALTREQDFFPRHGYAVLYSDYRDHADSDRDPGNAVRPRSGYVEDVLNLIAAARAAQLPGLDMARLGMFGFSMGGGITENIMVARPETAAAYVLLAPIHTDYQVNFDKWVATEWPETAQEFYQVYGTREANPEFWHDISAINFLDRVTSPVMLHQGERDGEVPAEWSRDLVSRLQALGKDITYHEYPGEPHILRTAANQTAMERTLRFFDEHVKNLPAE